MEAVSKIEPSFAINTIVNDNGEMTDLFCGNWISSHRAACQTYASEHTLTIAEKRDLVVVSCGGFPYDINLIQAHKALEMASKACRDGGTIIFLAECSDGLGRDDLLKWFEAKDSSAMADMLCAKYQVNGQTAWSLLTKAERFDIKIVTSLEGTQTSKMRLEKIDPDNLKAFDTGGRGQGLYYSERGEIYDHGMIYLDVVKVRAIESVWLRIERSDSLFPVNFKT